MYSQEVLLSDLKETLWTVGGLWTKLYFLFALRTSLSKSDLKALWHSVEGWLFMSHAPPEKLHSVHLTRLTSSKSLILVYYAAAASARFCALLLELKTNLLPTFCRLPTSGVSTNVKLQLDDITTGLPERQNRCFDFVHSWAKNTWWCGWKCSEQGNRCVSSQCVLSLLVPPLPHKSCEKSPKFLSVGDEKL